MYTSILAPIDTQAEEASQGILARALFLLKEGSATLHLLAVAPAGATDSVLAESIEKLKAFSEPHVGDYAERIEYLAKPGLPSDCTLECAEQINASVILIGSHRAGGSQLGRSALGGTAAKIATTAKCDVLIVRS